jgi:acetyl-CoA carboxylase biotin carboxylase subunit
VKKMFDKVLVANRGEIAVRVIRGLRELGIATVAVFSTADRGALHVRCADEAYPIGPAPSVESYLVGARIIETALACGAQAIHPGYGFLSENAAFARAVTDAGLTWIGPPADAIEAMGNKTVAREAMQRAGVPVVPGSKPLATRDEALSFARAAGFPVLVKAAAGGGGKGMRRVDREQDLAAAFEGAKREALAAFGDDTVYLEKFVVRPKHVEFQVLSDAHGHHVHLFERDCSVQRRHQKVIEETPCPVLRDEVRTRMGEVAVQAAAAVGYVGAGTVEFLLDESQQFYFLEMNTRLQVEHPITEMVTGLDLLHWQVRIAAGEALLFTQANLALTGASIECRVYAEDPQNGFRPCPGTIEHLRVPAGPGVRDDSGVYGGAEVPMYYDPMISKLVVWGPDRPTAIARMKRALSEYIVRGIRTNIRFHGAILSHPDFVAGTYDTQFLSRELEGLVESLNLSENSDLAAVVAALAAHERAAHPGAGSNRDDGEGSGPSGDPWRLLGRYRQLHRL